MTELPEDANLLFAYGTLQHGGMYHGLLEQISAEYLAAGRLRIRYPLLLAAYPCLLDHPGVGYNVEGEVYRIPESRGWIAIDRLEGHPVDYIRRLERVDLGKESVRAWTYFYIRNDLANTGLKPVPRFPAESSRPPA